MSKKICLPIFALLALFVTVSAGCGRQGYSNGYNGGGYGYNPSPVVVVQHPGYTRYPSVIHVYHNGGYGGTTHVIHHYGGGYSGNRTVHVYHH